MLYREMNRTVMLNVIILYDKREGKFEACIMHQSLLFGFIIFWFCVIILWFCGVQCLRLLVILPVPVPMLSAVWLCGGGG